MKTGVMCLLLFFLSGCVGMQPFIVKVDSLTNPSVQMSGNAVILPAEKISENDLQFLEYSEYVKRALIGKGIQVIKDKEAANIVILMKYGITDPQNNTYT